MIIQTSTGPVVLHFHHIRTCHSNPKKQRRYTLVRIHPGTCPEDPLGPDVNVSDGKLFCVLGKTSIANCSPKDQFSKVVGRKLALHRVMMEAGISRSLRAEIWKGYISQSKVK